MCVNHDVNERLSHAVDLLLDPNRINYNHST